jgi:hypothetical protein
MDSVSRIFEVVAWWDAIRRITGDSFYPALALGLVALMIVGAYRMPQLPWFTGRVALAISAILVLLLVMVVGLEVVSREKSEPEPSGAPQQSPFTRPQEPPAG